MATNNAINANSTTPLAKTNGGTGVNAVTTAPTASAFAGWDANKNLSTNNVLNGYTTTASAAGTTVLTVGSTGLQIFTGSSTQTVTMPVVSTLALGTSYTIINQSTGIVTVQSSGSNTIQAMAPNSTLVLSSNATSGTTAAVWNVQASSNIYTEGTWTPTDASGASLTLSAGGTYTRIGRMVVASCQVIYPSTANGSSAVIGGLPFTAANNAQELGGLVVWTSVSTLTRALVNFNATTFTLNSASGAAITNATMTSATSYFQLIYFV